LREKQKLKSKDKSKRMTTFLMLYFFKKFPSTQGVAGRAAGWLKEFLIYQNSLPHKLKKYGVKDGY